MVLSLGAPMLQTGTGRSLCYWTRAPLADNYTVSWPRRIYCVSTVLRGIEFVCLSLWLGSNVFLSFVVAPGAFRILGSPDQAGAIVGYSLWHMHFLGVVCGIVFLVARLLRTRTFASLVTVVVLCVVLMIALTVISEHAVSPKMAQLRLQMGSIQATAEDSPLLSEFRRFHRLSVTLESGVLLAGFAAMFLMVRELSSYH
jgi:uncharacterized membrane protein